jgi:hypothetical protein
LGRLLNPTQLANFFLTSAACAGAPFAASDAALWPAWYKPFEYIALLGEVAPVDPFGVPVLVPSAWPFE